MSLRTLETAILKGAKIALNNPKLRLKDILEWSTSPVKPESKEEVCFYVDDPGVHVCVNKAQDKRG